MKILLAEDDANIVIIAKITLEKIGHHQVTVATDGKITFEIASQNPFDLILLDGMVPHMDGVTVFKKLKELHIKTPVIFLSAKSQEADIKEVLDLGAIGYIQKPFEPKTLNDQILKFMKARASA